MNGCGAEQVDRVEMKNRFAFVYMPKLREAEAAMRGLNRAFGGESAMRLRVSACFTLLRRFTSLCV